VLDPSQRPRIANATVVTVNNPSNEKSKALAQSMSKDTPVEGQQSWGDMTDDAPSSTSADKGGKSSSSKAESAGKKESTSNATKNVGDAASPAPTPAPAPAPAPAAPASTSPAEAGEPGAAKKRTTAEE
jgi:hypothetical protein